MAQKVLDLPLPKIKALKEIITKTVLENHMKAWQHRIDCVIVGTLLLEIDMERTKPGFKYEKTSVRLTLGVVTDNCADGIKLILFKHIF